MDEYGEMRREPSSPSGSYEEIADSMESFNISVSNPDIFQSARDLSTNLNTLAPLPQRVKKHSSRNLSRDESLSSRNSKPNITRTKSNLIQTTLQFASTSEKNQENPKEFHSHRKSWSAHPEKTSLKVISITVWNYTRHCKNIYLHLKQFCYISSPYIRTPNIEDAIIRNVYLPSTRGISQKHHTGLLMCCDFQHTYRHILCRVPNDTRH